jgi:hypothetical protein
MDFFMLFAKKYMHFLGLNVKRFLNPSNYLVTSLSPPVYPRTTRSPNSFCMQRISFLFAVLFCLVANDIQAQCAFTPTITGDLLVCPDTHTVLSTQQYQAYQWYRRPFGGSTAQPVAGAGAQNFNVNYNDTPVYVSVEATQNGCTERSAEVLVDGLIFLPLVVQTVGDFEINENGDQVICTGDTIFQIALLPYTLNFQWYSGNDPIPGANDDTLAVTESGLYWLTASPGACPNITETLGVQIEVVFDNSPECLGSNVEEPRRLKASIAPNPAGEFLNIVAGTQEEVHAQLVDATGRTVRRLSFHIDATMFVGDLPDGVYTLYLGTKNAALTRKVVLH